jgi:hypothetical protein
MRCRLLLLLCAMSGCLAPSADLTALVSVKVKAVSASRCVRLEARSSPTNAVVVTKTLSGVPENHLFQIRQNTLSPNETKVRAVGFLDTVCAAGNESGESAGPLGITFANDPQQPSATLELGTGAPGDSDGADAGAPLGDGGTGDAGPPVTPPVVDAGLSDAGQPSDLSNFDSSVLSTGSVTKLVFTNDCTEVDTSPGTVAKEGCPVGIVVPMLAPNSGEALVFVADEIEVKSSYLKLSGTRPVALLARNSIVIDGLITLLEGAGGKSTCGGEGAGLLDPSYGGGAGGSYGTRGGAGGNGAARVGTTVMGQGGASASEHGAQSIVPLIGGCPGGGSGDVLVGTKGGRGGGALQLYAGQRIDISGQIHAPGGSGGAGIKELSTGGGGGGSGGAILIQTKDLSLTKKPMFTANGGSGGSGSVGNGEYDGKSGFSGSLTSFGALGAEEAFPKSGGGGGNGATASNTGDLRGLDGKDNTKVATVSLLGNGGGGGGGVGRIRIEVLSCKGPIGFVSPWPTYKPGGASCK